MKKILHTIYTCLLWMGFVGFALSGCKDDEPLKNNGEVVEGVPITVTFNLGGIPAADVTVETRASGNDLSGLSNLTIYIYDSQGNFQHKVSSYNGEKSLTVGTVSSPSGTSGVIYPVTFNTTSGTKKLLAVGNRGGGFWKASGNVDASTMTFEQFKSYLLDLNYIEQNGEIATPLQIVSDEQMLMSGWNEGITFDASGNVTNWGDLTGENHVAVQMQRAMAHVTFKIPSGSTTKTVEGNEHTVTFTPTSYSVYNVPVKTMLANMESEITPVNEETNKDVVTFKNFSATNIAAAEGDSYTFSFYMPENIYNNIKKDDGDELVYNDREAWEGQSLSATQKEWKYAPKTSTFVVISGSYVEVDANNNTVYTGNVQYTIHLGNFGKSTDTKRNFGDFSIERNCSYTYNVSVLGVDNIVVEAKKESGGQNGAEGQIYSYKGTTYSYNLDAHYEQVYLEYNLSSIAEAAHTAVTAAQNSDTPLSVDEAIANNLILVIQSEAMDYTAETQYYTTRNKRGTLKPYKIYIDEQNKVDGALTKDEVLKGAGTGIKPTKGFDYKWVELWPQKGETLAPYPGVSGWSRETGIADDVYGGTETDESRQLIDVYDAIVAMGKAVKLIYENTYTYEDETHKITTEEINEDGILVTKVDGDYKARFTAFINEYYYYKHPLTGAGITAWSVFVNKMPREMIIAMSSDVSDDGNSSYSQAYSYISQLSMQTPYSDRNDVVMEAFGVETYNETPITWPTATNQSIFSNITVSDGDLTSDDGRSNQLEWLKAVGSNTWSTYVNQSENGYMSSNTTTHASHKLSDAYNRQYYDNACMSRNRDLNGNGVIDNNEVRWYLASINEYLRMGLASQAISSIAQLYQGDKSDMTYSGYPNEYIKEGALYYSSSKADERVYWAVEKGAWGSEGSRGAMPIRCVRVLPAVGTGTEHNITSLNVKPESFFKSSHTVNGNTVLEFKNRMISDMYRVRTDDPLNEHNEDDPANRFSDGIIIARGNIKNGDNDASYTAPEINGITYVSSWDGSKTNLYKEDPCTGYHEYGDGGAKWRVPNLNELVMMRRALTTLTVENLNSLCCTQFSNSNVRLGFVATSNVNCEVGGYNNGGYWDWLASHGVRCVRDVPDGYVFPKN